MLLHASDTDDGPNRISPNAAVPGRSRQVSGQGGVNHRVAQLPHLHDAFHLTVGDYAIHYAPFLHICIHLVPVTLPRLAQHLIPMSCRANRHACDAYRQLGGESSKVTPRRCLCGAVLGEHFDRRGHLARLITPSPSHHWYRASLTGLIESHSLATRSQHFNAGQHRARPALQLP